ncbi:hypothetical protein N9T64_00645 [Pelagibacteraceae bacterium]|nr:hypothetical protein [Pelagibacteraceae bacterium]
MTKVNYKSGRRLALREHLMDGNVISILEMIALFGVQTPTATLSEFKRNGMLIKKRKVSMLSVLKRLNQYCHFKQPKNLPVKEILMTEYWVSK